jgi:hypothetical protein
LLSEAAAAAVGGTRDNNSPTQRSKETENDKEKESDASFTIDDRDDLLDDAEFVAGGSNIEEWMAEDDEEEEKHKSDKKSSHTALSTDSAYTNKTNTNTSNNINNNNNSSSNINKGTAQSVSSSSNYSNIHGIDPATTHPVAERKPFQSTRDMRVVFVGKPFEMVISNIEL